MGSLAQPSTYSRYEIIEADDEIRFDGLLRRQGRIGVSVLPTTYRSFMLGFCVEGAL